MVNQWQHIIGNVKGITACHKLIDTYQFSVGEVLLTVSIWKNQHGVYFAQMSHTLELPGNKPQPLTFGYHDSPLHALRETMAHIQRLINQTDSPEMFAHHLILNQDMLMVPTTLRECA